MAIAGEPADHLEADKDDDIREEQELLPQVVVHILISKDLLNIVNGETGEDSDGGAHEYIALHMFLLSC